MTTRGTPACRFLHLSLLTLVLLALAGAMAAEDPGERWRKRHDRGNRYEGRIEIPVANPTIDVLSLVGSRESYDKGDELTVRFFVPGEQDVVLQAREIEERVQYFMEAQRREWTAGQWNEFGPWPTGLLIREGVPAGNLGVLIRQGEGEEAVLLPAFVDLSEPSETLARYTLHVRPGSALSELTYRVLREDEELIGDRLADLEAGVAFSLKLETAELPEGRLRLELAGKLKGRPCGREGQKPCPGGTYAFYHRALKTSNETPAPDMPETPAPPPPAPPPGDPAASGVAGTD